MSLFGSYWKGDVLDVSDELRDYCAFHWPEVDLPSEFRSIDGWLVANPRRRPRNMKRFIANWMQRRKRFEEKAECVISDGVRCRVTAADRRTGRV